MKKILLIIPFGLFACGPGDVTIETPEISSPENTYYKWVEARINCDQKLAFEQLSPQSQKLTSIEYLEKSSLFECDSFDHKLIAKNHIEMNIGCPENFKRLHFDMTIENLTTSKKMDIATDYTFEKIGEKWYLIYLVEASDEIWAELFKIDTLPDYANIKNRLVELLKADPYNPSLHIYLAETLTSLKDFENAETSFENAITYSYEVPMWYYGSFGEMYTDKKDYVKAIEKYKIALTNSTSQRDSSYNYCRITRDFDLMGEKDSSSFYYNLAIKNDGENNWTNFDLARMYVTLKIPEKVLGYYDLGYGVENPITENNFNKLTKYVRRLIKISKVEADNKVYLLKAKQLCARGQKFNKTDEKLLGLISEVNALLVLN